MSKTRRVMLWVFCWLLGFGLLNAWSPTAAVFWLYGVGLATAVVKIRLWGNERARQARLISDLDHQHAAWKAGNDRISTYGVYQPPTLTPRMVREERESQTVPEPPPPIRPYRSFTKP